MFDGLDGQVHVKLRPVQVMQGGLLHTDKLGYWGIAEPWEFRERQKEFAVS